MQLYIGTVLSEGKIIDSSFKIHIPVLMPNLKARIGTDKVSIKTDRLLTKSVISTNTLTRRTYIEAGTITDYASRIDGANVFDMERVDGVTEVETVDLSEAVRATSNFKAKDTYVPKPLMCYASGVPHPNHVHRILGPMKFYKMKITNVNNIDVTKGTKCLVTKIGSKFYILNFIGIIPQDVDDYDYE